MAAWEASEEAGWSWARMAGAIAVVVAVVALAALPAAIAGGLVRPGGAIAAVVAGVAVAVATGKGASLVFALLDILNTPDL